MKRILAVDDMPTILNTIKTALRGEFEVFSAVSGQKAMELLGSAKFDLLLLDVTMPDISGFDVLDHVKEHPELKLMPVILITGNADRESVIRAGKAGAAGYIVKPFSVDTLRSKVREVLE
jgi:two-component system chemotaxis response regulator CheY